MFCCTNGAALAEQVSEHDAPSAQHTDARHEDRAALHSHDHTTVDIPDHCQPSASV